MSKLKELRERLRDILNQIPALDVSGQGDASRIKIGYSTFFENENFLNDLSIGNMFVNIESGFNDITQSHGDPQYQVEQNLTFYFGINKDTDNDLSAVDEILNEARELLMSQDEYIGCCMSPSEFKSVKTQLDTNNKVLAWSYKFTLTFMLVDNQYEDSIEENE